MRADVAVIGGGLVGSAIAYGLASRNVRVIVVDGVDRDFRAASANGGLVWVHGKGLDMPAYQKLTRESSDLWPRFCAELSDVAAVDLQYERNGGLILCLGEDQFEQQRASLMRLDNQLGGVRADWNMVDRSELAKLLPKVELGLEVTGASFGRLEGFANPLRLLSALHIAIGRKGGTLRGGNAVRSVRSDGAGGFTVDVGADSISAARVVIAAGLGSKALAAQVGLEIPTRPQRGQILITERLEPFLPLPIMGITQFREGTVMIGSTQEEVGLDSAVTGAGAAAMSATAVRSIPALAEATLVRQWPGLRIVTPDGHPIYAESQTYPGAFVATCHSGVTLAAAHAGLLAEFIAAGRLPPSMDVFHQRRFDVQEAA